MKQDYFRVFANCIVTKGVTRSVIADIQRQQSEFIPNSLAEVMERLNRKESISSLFSDYGPENEETLKAYLDFLVQEDYGFYCNPEEFERFPDLDTTFDSPCIVSNIIIETKKADIPRLQALAGQIEALGCKDVAIVFYEPLDCSDFQDIRASFDQTIVKSVALISQYSSLITESFLQEISIQFERLTSLVFYSAPQKDAVAWNNKILCDVSSTDRHYTNFSFCGGVNMEHFNTNLPKVLEAIHHNSCLHKKIAVDINGNIRNCPSMPEHYGNIRDTTLAQALAHPSFKSYWQLNKDHIATCRDCEFRHICTDCRAYTERTHLTGSIDTSKPLKCGYDPYTAQWEEWSTSPLKQKAMKEYGMLV